MNPHVARFASVMVLSVFALVCSPRALAAQQMNFSYYSDAAISSDGQTAYGWVDGYDNSTGCQHYDYSTYGEYYTPSGLYTQTYSGLSTWFGAPADDGYFSVWTASSVSCSCFGSGLGAGGGSRGFQVETKTTYYKYCDTLSPPMCKCNTVECASGTATCSGSNVVLAVVNSCFYHDYVKVDWKVISMGNYQGCTHIYGWGVDQSGACT
jgi:hypothetical protein